MYDLFSAMRKLPSFETLTSFSLDGVRRQSTYMGSGDYYPESEISDLHRPVYPVAPVVLNLTADEVEKIRARNFQIMNNPKS